MHRVSYLLWLKHMGIASAGKLIDALEYFGSPEELYNADREAYEESGMFTDKEIEYLTDKSTAFADSEVERCNAQRTYLVDYYSKFYPPLLREIPEPPLVLYVMGDRSALVSPCITVVGSRKADSYGINAAADISGAFAQSGYTIVSGMAVGIDTAASTGAISSGGKSVGVLCCGMDVTYPADSAPMRERIIASGGAVITEFEFGVNPLSGYFQIRNRIMAGMSELTVVAQAGEKSGALITLSHAEDFGRETAAIPGNISNEASRGCNAAIANGTKMIYDIPSFVLEYIKEHEKTVKEPEKEKEPEKKPSRAAVSEGETESDNMTELKRLLHEKPMTAEELAEKSGRTLKWVNSTLIILEVSGKVKKEGATYTIA